MFASDNPKLINIIVLYLLTGVGVIFISHICSAQENSTNLTKIDFSLCESDIAETVLSLKTNNPSKTAELFRQKMPPPTIDTKFRKKIIEGLPSFVEKLRVHDEILAMKLKLLMDPILSFYSRDKVYEIIIIRHDTPFLMSDSGVVLVISTGLINETQNDDELLGFLAHEVGHEYFQKYSIYSKHLLSLVEENGKEKALTRHLSAFLLILEAQCDAFAAITLSHLKYNPIAMANFLERTAKKFPHHSSDSHPSDSIRRNIISKVIPSSFLVKESKISLQLVSLQKQSMAVAKNN
jgi:hypothetical protein